MNTGTRFYTANKNSTKRLESDGVKLITYSTCILSRLNNRVFYAGLKRELSIENDGLKSRVSKFKSYQPTEFCQNNNELGLYHDVWYTDSTSGSVA